MTASAAQKRAAMNRSTALVVRSRENLDGFKKVGLGYDRTGHGGRNWRINRFRGGFAVRLEAILGDTYLVDEFATSFGAAIQLARYWDGQLDGGAPSNYVSPSFDP